jgi:DNA-binding FadR family transcriptional regulator
MQGLTEAVQREHQAIFDAVAAGDAEGAQAAAITHLENAAARLTLYLAPRGAKSAAD